MDRQSSLTLRLSAPLPRPPLPPYTYPLACSLALARFSLSAAVSSPARSFSSESIQPLDARLYTAAGYSKNSRVSRCVASATYYGGHARHEYSEFHPLLFRRTTFLRLLRFSARYKKHGVTVVIAQVSNDGLSEANSSLQMDASVGSKSF